MNVIAPECYTFAATYQYLSYKYGLIEADWFTPLGHLRF